MDSSRVTVVFISGFLSPKNWQSYPSGAIPKNVDVVTVNPSPTGSLHDRACQIFYELYGGTIDYGKEHSEYHKHERFGRSFAKGKLPQWSRNSPIVIIGHSLGGSTAWVLQNYLASRMFPGIDTCAGWVSGIVCVSSPLNGALQVHSKGMDVRFPPIVRWASPGCIVGWIAQWCEFFDFKFVQEIMDFQHEHWNLTWRSPTAAYQLLLSALGFCLHSGTDNIAYDVTVRSQLAWAKTLRTLPGSYYISVAGSLPASSAWYGGLPRWLLGGESHTQLYGVDTSGWMQTGSDGLLSVFTQQRPHLADLHPWCSDCAPKQRKAKRTAPQISIEKAGRSVAHPYSHVTEKDISAGAPLRNGVWHCVDREMSHLTAALACMDTWTLLMQAAVRIAELHGRAPSSPRSVAHISPVASDDSPGALGQASGTPQSSSSHQSGCSTCTAAYPRADMQGVDLDVHGDHSSRGMAYRLQNIDAALVLSAVLLCTSPTLAGSVPIDKSTYYACAAALVLAFLTNAVRHIWVPSPSIVTESAEILPNYAHIYSDILEIFLAASGVYASVTTTVSYNNSDILLIGIILQYLLPRALLDYGLPVQNTVAAVLLVALPAVGAAFCSVAVQGPLAVMVVLPKACWAVIYATQVDAVRGYTRARQVRCVFVWAAVALFASCTCCYQLSLHAAYSAWTAHTWLTTAGMFLVAVLPLSAFQDLSECFQYIMIERKYAAAEPVVREQ